jgi:predicted amino acid dehydrogenase
MPGAKFAFIIHPIDPRGDVKKRFPLLGTYLPLPLIHFLSGYFPPLVISKVRGLRSEATGEEVEGWLLACPLTAKRMLEVPTDFAYRKIIATGRLAERLGAQIVGLGAFTSVVGDAGITVARELSIPVTTGNSYTVAASVRIAEEAAKRKALRIEEATVAVLGATGSIGRAIVRFFAPKVKRIIMIGRSMASLEKVRGTLPGNSEAIATTDIAFLREADIIMLAASSAEPLVRSEHLKEGAIVCDIAIPPNLSPEVKARKDLVLLRGGVVKAPGNPELGVDIGLPKGYVYACMAETIALAMEGKLEDYTLGRGISLEKVEEIEKIARKHGFTPVIL